MRALAFGLIVLFLVPGCVKTAGELEVDPCSTARPSLEEIQPSAHDDPVLLAANTSSTFTFRGGGWQQVALRVCQEALLILREDGGTRSQDVPREDSFVFALAFPTAAGPLGNETFPLVNVDGMDADGGGGGRGAAAATQFLLFALPARIAKAGQDWTLMVFHNQLETRIRVDVLAAGAKIRDAVEFSHIVDSQTPRPGWGIFRPTSGTGPSGPLDRDLTWRVGKDALGPAFAYGVIAYRPQPGRYEYRNEVDRWDLRWESGNESGARSGSVGHAPSLGRDPFFRLLSAPLAQASSVELVRHVTADGFGLGQGTYLTALFLVPVDEATAVIRPPPQAPPAGPNP